MLQLVDGDLKLGPFPVEPLHFLAFDRRHTNRHIPGLFAPRDRLLRVRHPLHEFPSRLLFFLAGFRQHDEVRTAGRHAVALLGREKGRADIKRRLFEQPAQGHRRREDHGRLSVHKIGLRHLPGVVFFARWPFHDSFVDHRLPKPNRFDPLLRVEPNGLAVFAQNLAAVLKDERFIEPDVNRGLKPPYLLFAVFFGQFLCKLTQFVPRFGPLRVEPGFPQHVPVQVEQRSAAVKRERVKFPLPIRVSEQPGNEIAQVDAVFSPHVRREILQRPAAGKGGDGGDFDHRDVGRISGGDCRHNLRVILVIVALVCRLYFHLRLRRIKLVHQLLDHLPVFSAQGIPEIDFHRFPACTLRAVFAGIPGRCRHAFGRRPARRKQRQGEEQAEEQRRRFFMVPTPDFNNFVYFIPEYTNARMICRCATKKRSRIGNTSMTFPAMTRFQLTPPSDSFSIATPTGKVRMCS